MVECPLRDHGRELRADAVAAVSLVDDDRAAGLRRRVDERRRVSSGDERARIDDLGRDPLGSEQLGGLETQARPSSSCRRASRRRPRASRRRRRAGIGVLALRNLAGHAPVHLVLDEDDRVVVADRRLEQTLRVVRGRRQHDLQARARARPRLAGSGCAARPSGASRRASSAGRAARSGCRPTCSAPSPPGSRAGP